MCLSHNYKGPANRLKCFEKITLGLFTLITANYLMNCYNDNTITKYFNKLHRIDLITEAKNLCLEFIKSNTIEFIISTSHYNGDRECCIINGKELNIQKQGKINYKQAR